MIELAPDLFLHEATIRFYGATLPTRMTVVRLRDNALFVHSPTPLDESTRSALDELGSVRFIVSPNKIHNQALGDFAAAYPEAALFASPGLEERRPELRFDGVLDDAPRPEWANELDQAATAGNVFFSEILFLHRATRTLIVADLVENFAPGTVAPSTRLLASLFGVGRKPTASPEFRIYTVDADAAATSLKRPREWDFERIVLSHGELVVSDASRVFGTVCDDLLGRVRRKSGFARLTARFLARHQ